MATLNLSLLDGIRLNYGADKLRQTFYDMVVANRMDALQILNDPNLHFPTLYLLQPEISKLNLLGGLSKQNKLALEFSTAFVTRRDNRKTGQHTGQQVEDREVLKWMLETGYKEDGMNDQFDRVLEVSVLLLVKIHQDRSCLPYVVEMIFNRYRKGFYIYDLVWAFYESGDKDALLLAANRLDSPDRSDAALARKLLGFIPILGAEAGMITEKTKEAVIRWIHENKKFLRFTGESFQQTPSPCQYILDHEFKYLQKSVAGTEKNNDRGYTEEELTLLQHFQTLDQETRELLSACSARLYQESRPWWHQWIHSPVKQQIFLARQIGGGGGS